MASKKVLSDKDYFDNGVDSYNFGKPEAAASSSQQHTDLTQIFHEVNAPRPSTSSFPHGSYQSQQSKKLPKPEGQYLAKQGNSWTSSFNGTKRDINILILGETGVGKSTWINGFRNFLAYNTLNDAENSELHTLIPSEFTVCDETLEEDTGSTANDKNETNKAGQTRTQAAKVYKFEAGNLMLKLIDTPGIGHTKGIDQDNVNFKNILSTLSYFNELHGICILLKPNNARLAVMFQFCIKELLTQINGDATKNIMFCFTHTRETFYQPGDTLPALKTLLEQNKEFKIPVNDSTVYCYDNEAYQFLAATKNKIPVRFDKSQRKNFEISWEKSLNETKRMLEYILELRPHPIRNTFSVNHARELVLKLSRPLAEVIQNINLNKTIAQQEKETIRGTKDINKLKKQRYTTFVELQITRLDYPKTVCANANCIKTLPLAGTTGKYAVEYVTTCHDHCYLKGVTEDCKGHMGLLDCLAIVNGNCRHSNCRHSYREHLHIYYDSVQVTSQVENQALMHAVNKNLIGSEMKEDMIREKNARIQEYENEQKTIQKISARFAYFLKHTNIIPENDAFEEYLDHLLQEEQNKFSTKADPCILENLKNMKASYISEKEILETELSSDGASGPVLNPTEIETLVEQLKNLKHSGRLLKNALDCVEHTKRYIYDSEVVYNTAKHFQKLNPSLDVSGPPIKSKGTLSKITKFLQKRFEDFFED